jgi:hypothetical protein
MCQMPLNRCADIGRGNQQELLAVALHRGGEIGCGSPAAVVLALELIKLPSLKHTLDRLVRRPAQDSSATIGAHGGVGIDNIHAFPQRLHRTSLWCVELGL